VQHLVLQLYLEKIVADCIEVPPPVTSTSATSSTASLSLDTTSSASSSLSVAAATARARRGSVSSGGLGLPLPDFVLQAFFSRYGLKSLAEAQMVRRMLLTEIPSFSLTIHSFLAL
jgi:hypothetical protein